MLDSGAERRDPDRAAPATPDDGRLIPASLPRRVRNTAWLAALSWRERSLPWWPADRLRALQDERVGAAVEHAWRTVPWWRQAMDERGLRPADVGSADELGRLGLIDGAMVRAQVDAFTSSAFGDGERQTFHTSGSETGVRREIHWDAGYLLRGLAWAERDRVILARLAGEARLRSRLREALPGPRSERLLRGVLGDPADHQRLSIFPGHAEMRVMRVLWSEHALVPARPAHHHFMPAQAPFETVLSRMNEVRPRIVFSFGSYAEHFLRRLADTGVRVAAPKVWMTNSDHISDDARHLALERFGCRVYSVYSAMEAHRLGIQCERLDGYHLNLDAYVVRIVDQDGREVPAGTEGEIVVSNLLNRAMPLLNYRIGDRGVLAPEPCPCGRTLPLLARLEGRRSDTIRLPDGRVLSSLALEGLFRAELRPTLKAQIDQPAEGVVRWRVVPFTGADPDEVRRALLARAPEALGRSARLDVEIVDELPYTPGGKFLRVARPAPGDPG